MTVADASLSTSFDNDRLSYQIVQSTPMRARSDILDEQSRSAARRSQNLQQRLARAQRQLNLSICAELARRGYNDIRLVHARLLENLDYEGNSISVVARRADMTKQAMGALAMELERKGYVIRSVDKSDGRIWRLQFTRKGWQLMLETSDIVANIEAALQSHLRPITVESLNRSLDAFAGLGAERSLVDSSPMGVAQRVATIVTSLDGEAMSR